MFNKVILIGNVGNDPEIKRFQNGNQMANFNLATSESYKDKNGEKQTKTEWHKIFITNQNLVKIVEQYVVKGSRLLIEGSLRYEEYEDKQGIKRHTTKIELNNFNSTLKILSNNLNDSYEPKKEEKSSPIQDDEIPF